MSEQNKLSDERLTAVLTSLPSDERPDGYPRQTMVQVAWLRSILSELLSRRASAGGEVKPLEWFSRPNWHGMLFARSIFGDATEAHYKITEYGEWASPCASSYFDAGDVEAAKAAAQADYSARILSALSQERAE